MLVTLVTDNIGVVDISQIFGANDRDVQNAHGTLNGVVTMNLPGLSQLLLSLLEPGIVAQDALLDFLLTLNQLVFGQDVLL